MAQIDRKATVSRAGSIPHEGQRGVRWYRRCKIVKWVKERLRSPTPELEEDSICNVACTCPICSADRCSLPTHEGSAHGCLICSTHYNQMLVLGERAERTRGKEIKSQQKSFADICQPAPLPNADKEEDSEREELVDADDALTEAECNLLHL